MKSGRNSRRSICYSLFIGVLAGSVLSGSGAFAAEPVIPISAEYSSTDPELEVPIYGLDYIKNHLNGEFLLTNNITLTHVGTTLGTLTDSDGHPFTGVLNGDGFKISGLANPLFESLEGATVKNLTLMTTGDGVEATLSCVHACVYLDNVGAVAKSANDSIILKVYVLGTVEGNNNVGGLIGESTNTEILGSSFSGKIISNGIAVGGLVGKSTECVGCDSEIPGTLILNSSVVTSTITGHEDVGGLVGSGYGRIRNSSADVDINGTNNLGGLIGNSQMTIDHSNSSGTVDATGDNAGGISGKQDYFSISYSFSNSAITGSTGVGGLVGSTAGGVIIQSSYATGEVRNSESGSGIWFGGLVGWAQQTVIANSYASGNVYGSPDSISSNYGGLVGTLYDATLRNSYSSGDVFAKLNAGSLVGMVEGSSILNSFALGETTRISGDSIFFSNFVGNAGLAYGVIEPTHNSELIPISLPYEFISVVTSKIDLLNTGLEAADWEACSGIIGGMPHLLSKLDAYAGTCASVDADQPIRERIERDVREVKEARSPEKIEKTIGFKSESLLPKTAPIIFVEATEKIDLTKVKAVEIAPTANVKVNAKAGEALQISLKSESKEPVELWVKSPDGSWLLAGVITFDKDGKAILPPLQFKNAGGYTLVLNKPSADSAKGSAPLNQTGSLLVAVS
jgi:hypothetical protein